MRLFEDILDDLTAIDSKAKQSAVSDSDKLYEPMDVEQFEVLLRFNVFYDIYLTKAQQVGRIKERVGDVLEATSGLSSYSRVLCVTDTTAPMYIKLTDEIEEDPYKSGEIWIMFAINPDFRNFKDALYFITRVCYAIASCKLKDGDINARPKMDFRTNSGINHWSYVDTYSDLSLLAARLKSEKNSTFSYNAMKRTEVVLQCLKLSDFEAFYKFPEWCEERGQEEWCRLKIEDLVDSEVTFGSIPSDLYGSIQRVPIHIYSWGNARDNKDIYLCPPDAQLKDLISKGWQDTLLSARHQCVLSNVRDQLKKELKDKDWRVDYAVLFVVPQTNHGPFMYFKLKECGIGLVVRGYDRYTGARQLWEFVTCECEDTTSTDEENEK